MQKKGKVFMDDKLKLYVVGEISPNPEEWEIYDERAFVVARSVEEAKELGGYGCATEIPMNRPMLLGFELPYKRL
jgi:hypothetical protein